MRILVISGDPKAIEEGSNVSKRLEAQAELVDRLDVFVRAKEEEEMYLGDKCRVRSFKGSRLSVALAMAREGIERQKYDIVTAQDPFFLGLIAWRISRVTGAALQLQLHTDLFSSAFWKHSLKNKISYVIARLLIPQAHCVRVVSEKLKAGITRWNRRVQVVVLPVFVDAEAIQKEKAVDLKKLYPQFEQILLVVSRLEWEKQVSQAVRAMRTIKKAYPKAGLLIAGEGTKRKMLNDLVLRMGLQNNVVFLGWRTDTVALYKGADVMVQTSSYEGYGAAVIEALLCGCPVVSTDVGVAREAGARIASLDGIGDEVIRVLQSRERGVLKMQLLPIDEYAKTLVASYTACVRGT